MFFLGGGKCPNMGVVNVRILGVVNVRLANNLTPHQDIFSVCSEYVQGMFRACSEYVQSMLRVCSEYIQIMFRVSLITGNPPN